MKYRLLISAFLVITLAFCLAGCTKPSEQTNNDRMASNMNDFGEVFFFNSFEELIQKKQETIKNIESLGGREVLMNVQDKEGNYVTMKERERDFNLMYDPAKLTELDYFYLPVYAEKLCELANIMAIDLNISATYSLKGFSRNDFSVEMARQPDPKALMEWVLEEYVDLKPWEGVEGVYYKHVESSMGKSIHFYFLNNGECFFMRVSRELIDEIRKTDPEALNGALFELRKIDL